MLVWNILRAPIEKVDMYAKGHDNLKRRGGKISTRPSIVQDVY